MGFRMVKIFLALGDLQRSKVEGQTLKTLKVEYLEKGTR